MVATRAYDISLNKETIATFRFTPKYWTTKSYWSMERKSCFHFSIEITKNKTKKKLVEDINLFIILYFKTFLYLLSTCETLLYVLKICIPFSKHLKICESPFIWFEPKGSPTAKPSASTTTSPSFVWFEAGHIYSRIFGRDVCTFTKLLFRKD